jgi:predicted dehydrogenase
MVALASGIAPAVARLRVLLDKHLGPVRSVSCTKSIDRVATGPALLASKTLLEGIHLCRQLIGAAPETVWAAVPEAGSMVNLTFAFPGGPVASIALTVGRSAPWRAVVSAEKGSAEALLPRRLRWQDAGGWHALCLPRERAPVVLLRRFAEAVAAGRSPQPSLEDACQAYAWLEMARRSHAESRSIGFDLV